MTKPHITHTLGPIHFDDLDPHRFEDLVRQLIYDLKQWQSIESTGRGGADDGFDVRAYEVAQEQTNHNEEEGEYEEPHPMEGNLWMIQCKREKRLGPQRIEAIIREALNAESLPYGYILAAPAHFSKVAHDKFRDELRSRGVMEFYLWGAGELEDMLYQPKNDHILFAFFGISLTSRRRSKTTEIRTTVNAKNKLMRILSSNPNHQPVLLRDLQDRHYPYKDEYKDFDKRPRWKQYSAIEFHPLGLIVSVARYYAYFDKAKAVWDYAKAVNDVNPLPGNSEIWRDNEKKALRNAVKGFWENLPNANRTIFCYLGLIRFDSIALIDDKGDAEFECPHIFLDFYNEHGPFSRRIEYLEINEQDNEWLDGYTQVKIFPETFPNPSFGTIHEDRSISVDDRIREQLKQNRDRFITHGVGITVYDAEKRYGYLEPTDVIAVYESEDAEGKPALLKITNVRTMSGRQLLVAFKDNPALKEDIERQILRELKSADAIQIVEAKVLYDWQLQQNRPVVG